MAGEWKAEQFCGLNWLVESPSKNVVAMCSDPAQCTALAARLNAAERMRALLKESRTSLAILLGKADPKGTGFDTSRELIRAIDAALGEGEQNRKENNATTNQT